MEFATIFILAITVEALVEYFKLIFNKTINWKQVGAIILGIVLSVLCGTDLYKMVGIDFMIPFVGSVITGIIFSRGANYLADFVKRIQTQKAAVDISVQGQPVPVVREEK